MSKTERELELEEENRDLNETIKYWFDLRKLGQDELVPIFNDGVAGYLRRSRSGGMPSALSNKVEAVTQDFARLYLMDVMWPVLRKLAEEHHETLLKTAPEK